MQTRRELLASAALLADRGVRLVDTRGEKVAALWGGATLCEYRYSADRPKPYVHPLCLPGGKPISLDGPADHVHHRGLMEAWSEVDGVDYWGEVNPARHGRIVHRRFERLREGSPAEIAAVNEWIDENGLALVERRTLRIPPPLAEGVWLDWTSELEAARRPVRLAAGKHVYNGLGIRVTREMDGGAALNSRGSTAIDKANGEPAEWCAYHAAGAGVAFFDHPRNPRHPNAFFVMNKAFGYMSAAPTFREPFELARGERIRFRWGVLAFAGEARAAALDRRFREWSKER